MNPYYRQWDNSDLNSWLGRDEFTDDDIDCPDTDSCDEEYDTDSCHDEEIEE
jgi:hypothetical protein